MPNMSDEEKVESITVELEKLWVKCTQSAAALHEKRVKADKLSCSIEHRQNELASLNQRVRQLKSKRSCVHFVELLPPADCNGTELKIKAVIKIIKQYTNFRTRLPNPKGSKKSAFRFRKTIIRGGCVSGYDPDKFGSVEYIQRPFNQNNGFDKLYFTTDLGFQTWRASANIAVYDRERGNIDAVVKQECYYDSRPH